MDALDAIRNRRSIGRLVEPAPAGDHLAAIVRAGASAPDHGGLRPFKFVVLEGQGQDEFGQVLADAYLTRCERDGVEPVDAKHEKERTKLGRAPMVIVVCAIRRESDKIPWIEQQMAAAAAAQNILVAATALGYGSMWRTGDPAYDSMVKGALGLTEDDAIVGFLYIGTATDAARKPPREPEADDLMEFYSG